MVKEKKILKKELYYQYITLKKSIKKCAIYFKCSDATIHKKLKKYKIDIRSTSLNIKKDILYHQYITLNKNQNDCAKYFKCNESTIRDYLKKYSISKKPNITKKELYHQYITLSKNQDDCALFFKCSRDTIKKRLKKYDIKKTKQEKQNTIKKSNLKKYGVEYCFQSDYIKTKIYNTKKEKYGTPSFNQRNIKNFNIWENDRYLIKWIKTEANTKGRRLLIEDISLFFNVHQSSLHKRLNDIDLNIYKYINVNPKSKKEEIVSNFLLDKGIRFRRNVRSLISPYELDFVIQDKKIAIEVNDTWSHSVEFRMKRDKISFSSAKNYHNMKTELCKEKGYRLIHIFEKDLNDLSNTLSILLSSNPVNARDLIYKHNYPVRDFIIKNHQQHTCLMKNGGALLDKNKNIIGAITFRKNKNKLHLDKLCFKKGYNVRGGSSKLFKNYLKNINLSQFESVVTFCDTTYHTGKVYEKLGFKNIDETNNNYFWVKDDEWIFRRNAQIKNLKNKFNLDDNYINNIKGNKEKEIMHKKGYSQIFLCKHIKYEYQL